MTNAGHFDAIVVGSGITGGWAAKELSEHGLKVLVLERGRRIEHGGDYRGEHQPPWEIPFGGRPLRELYEQQYPIQSRCDAFDETTRHFWNNDRDNPYVYDPQKPFHWIRADVLGGRSLLWARQVYRWSDLDFAANARDGRGSDWPLRYRDLERWYSHVERFIGVSGQPEGLPHLPDGEFLPPMSLNQVERATKAAIEARFPQRRVTIGRTAVLTQAHGGRSPCHYCGICERGCSTGSYFSSLSATLPAAHATGNLTVLTDSVVSSLTYDSASRRVSAVQVIDAVTRATRNYSARVVFLCASSVGSLQIMLNSRSESFPTGLANRSGVLGRYFMDHTGDTSVVGYVPGFEDAYVEGYRPNGIYIPRFRNLDGQDADADFLRGYGYQGGAERLDWRDMSERLPGFGAQYKQALRRPGPWLVYLDAYGECLPYRDNTVTLDERRVDRYGIPLVRFDLTFRDNEARQRRDSLRQGRAMLEAIGAYDIRTIDGTHAGGDAIHEMGGARMGHDPRDSVLNAWNRTHDVRNLFVTDGACMTSSSCVNPSMTYMTLTARAANYAVELLKAGELA